MNEPPRSADGFTLVEVLIAIAMIMLLAGLVVAVARQINDQILAKQTHAHIKAIEEGLQAYHNKNHKYPLESRDASGNIEPIAAAVDDVVEELRLKGDLKRKMAEDNRLDGWGRTMVYLTYDYTADRPVCEYDPNIAPGRGNWKPSVDELLASGAFDTGSGHPVILSGGPDGDFGTPDDRDNRRQVDPGND
jgi:type II secretory pathway pseudopilin PulG